MGTLESSGVLKVSMSRPRPSPIIIITGRGWGVGHMSIVKLPR